MKGLRCVRGYIQIRLTHKGQSYERYFGRDCEPSGCTHRDVCPRSMAEIHLSEKRREILMGKFGIEKPLPEMKFKQVVPLHMSLWTAEKDGDGKPAHSERAIEEKQRVFDKSLLPFFGETAFHVIRPLDVERWREKRLATGVLGTSVNREMVPLSTIFADTIRAVALEQIPKFKLPTENPCKHVTKAKTRKRERIPTDYELKKLKLACMTLEDQDGWEICKLALKSILSEADLRKLEIGSTIDLERSKTGVQVHIPVTVLHKLNWRNWRRRWGSIRREAGIHDLQFRDLRKKGGNYLIGRHDTKLVSQYFGHASIRTTEQSYVVVQQERMRPLAQDLNSWVEGI